MNFYNFRRPHQAMNNQMPMAVKTAAPRAAKRNASLRLGARRGTFILGAKRAQRRVLTRSARNSFADFGDAPNPMALSSSETVSSKLKSSSGRAVHSFRSRLCIGLPSNNSASLASLYKVRAAFAFLMSSGCSSAFRSRHVAVPWKSTIANRGYSGSLLIGCSYIKKSTGIGFQYERTRSRSHTLR